MFTGANCYSRADSIMCTVSRNVLDSFFKPNGLITNLYSRQGDVNIVLFLSRPSMSTCQLPEQASHANNMRASHNESKMVHSLVSVDVLNCHSPQLSVLDTEL